MKAFDPFDGEAIAGAVVNGSVGDEAEDVDAFEGVLEFVHHHAAQDVFGLVDAGRVYQDDLSVFAIQDALNAIAGGLGLGRDDGDFLADEGIDECGFARVGAAYDCDETGFEGHRLVNCTPLESREEDRGRRCVACGKKSKDLTQSSQRKGGEKSEKDSRESLPLRCPTPSRYTPGAPDIRRLLRPPKLHYRWMNWRRTNRAHGFPHYESLTSRLIVIDFIASRFIAATLAGVFPRSTL